MSLSNDIGCHVDKELNYIKLMCTVSETRKIILDISKDIGLSDDNTQRMVKKLQSYGYIKKIFAGKCRYILLTEKGKTAIKGVM